PRPSSVFVRVRPPPGSPLFPYTTLFRSGHWRGLTAIDHFDTDPVENGTLEEFRELVEAAHARGITVVTYIALIYMHHDNPLFLQDRKSTRLNSSHVKISYAVFCLKKKKQ